ncbi:neuronal acetylcholine receptor subunit alpha-3-like [Mercenaria mercenaria]|uniref:neuronal acetylcholine receptor subunit alpha-3-like n=1 Tax=Mercenaria mercenaria TaxID=6596 RepID=UPI00234F5333|nr:neuronal acetylcholine receptor subunit alpha-3-like [Mercenaria mercenaria]
MYNILFSWIIVQTFVTSYGQTYGEMDTLLGHLFNASRYNTYLRPLRNQSQVMMVNFTQYISSIDFFDITSGELQITGFFEITWTDDFLTWSPSLYGGKEMLSLPTGTFWKPEFSLTNGPANDKSSIYNSGFYPTWVSYQGSVIMIPGGSYKTKCNVDPTFYPFDIHNCNFQFIVSNHDSAELMLISQTGDINSSNLTENGEWEIQNIDVKVVLLKEDNIKLSIPMLQASFSLKRRPIYEIVNVYAPILLMSFLNIVTCFVRPDSGERLTFAVTLYLSLVFATTAAIEKIPKNSLKMPIMSYEFLCNNCINTIGVTWSIFIVHLASKSKVQQRLPHFLVKMVMKKRRRKTYDSELQPDCKSEVKSESSDDDNFFDENKANPKQQKVAEYLSEDDITGLEIAEILDTIYFWFVSLFVVVVNSVFGYLVLRIEMQ